MSIQKCIAVIKKANKSGTIDDDAAMEMLSEIDEFISGVKNADNVEQELMQHLQQKLSDSTLAAKIEKRNKIINALAKARARNFLDNFENPHQGIMSLLGGTLEASHKSKLSIDTQGKSLANKYTGKLIKLLDNEHGDIRLFKKGGKYDDDIAAELWELRPGGNPGVTKNAAARRIAEAIHSVQELAVKNSNLAGSYIKSYPGYIMRQSHDMIKIRKMGEDEWIDFIMPLLDKKTFKGADPKKFLQGAYRGLAAGIHRRATGAAEDTAQHLNGFKGYANLGKKASAERLLHFKDAASFMEYNRAVGTGDLREGIVSGLTQHAHNTALMRNLGTNPQSMLDDLVAEYRDRTVKAGNVKQSDLFKSQKIKNLYQELDGSARMIAAPNLARVGAITRVLANVSKLGGATISAITDIPYQAAELRYQGKGLMSGYTNAFRNLFRGRGNKEQRQIARALGVGFDGVTGDLLSRFHANDQLPGMFAKAQQKFFKINLMSWWNDSHRTGMSLMMSANLADNANLSYKQLGPRLQNVLKQYGIEDAEWDIYRQHGVKDAGNNQGMFMVSEGLEDMSDDVVKSYMKSKGKSVFNARTVADARNELMTMLDSFFIDRADYGIPMPGARERAIMNQGSVAGTATGEMYRLLMQFKSFPVTIVRRGLGREVYGQADGKADITGITQLLVMSTVFGYGAMMAKDMLKGRSPREFSYQTALAAMVQGGGLGIYGDFLFGEYNRFGRSFLSTLAGPTFGQIDAVAELWTRARNGEDVAANLIRLAKDNTPFINVFYLRMAIDYLFLYQLQEFVNPGYLSRLEQRIMTENDQRFFMPPSRAIPYGGGDRLFEGVR
tara:strand:- start:3872 stop:6388 length:2517 start_codon:yes stop_codon:yes gene_type:complete